MNYKDLKDSIFNDLNPLLEKHLRIQKNSRERMKHHNIEYRPQTERTIAAFYVNNILREVDFHRVDELPIRSISTKKIIEDITDKYELENSKINELKKYLNYNEVDGFFYIKGDDKSEFDIFIEFKVSESKSKKSKINFLNDHLKWKVYMANSDIKSIYLYIDFVKEKKPNLHFLKFSNPHIELSGEIASKMYDLSSTSSNAYFDIKYPKKDLEIDIKDMEGDLFSEVAYKSVLIDSMVENFNETDKKDDIKSLDETDFVNYDEKKWYKMREIYGSKVAFSYKALVNSNVILNIHRILREKREISGDITETVEERYTEIKSFLNRINAERVGFNKGTDAAKKTNNQRTNWLLATIEFGVKYFWKDIYDKETEEKEFLFDISEVKSNGKKRVAKYKVENYDLMILVIEAILIKGYKSDTIARFSNWYLSEPHSSNNPLEEFEKKYLNKKLDDELKNYNNERDKIKFIIMHTFKLYNELLEWGDSNMPNFIPQYQKYKFKKDLINNINKISKNYKKFKKFKISHSVDSMSDYISDKIDELVLLLENK